MDNSKELSTADLDWAIGINRISLKIIGLWPTNKLTRQQRILADVRAFIIFVTMMSASILPGILALLRVWGDVMAMSDNLQIGLPFTATGIKYIIMWFRRSDLVPIINMIVEDWMREKTAQERNAMIKQARFARAIVMFGAIAMSFASIVLIIPPCFGYTSRYLTNLTDPVKERPFLLQTYYLRDSSQSPYYEIAFTAQAISIVMAAISYTGIDTFLGLVVFHICAQLDILKERMLNLNNFKDFRTGLRFNIKDHLRLIRSVDVIDNTFNLMLLALLVFFAMLFCLQGFLIVSVSCRKGGELFFQKFVIRSLTGKAIFLICEYVGLFQFLLIHSFTCACTAWSEKFL
ncbi:uncharacterized protein [Linepithema humile]|uniref:uncharacterized protein isoform X2 n=1 Tax=Linepithema humile TaxID=83485 RepID=UPI00351DEE14